MQFITRTAAIGIALNAWFLLGLVHMLAQHPDLRNTIPFITRLLTEQGAEKVFRAMRAVLGGENFTLSDFFRRYDRVMALSILRAVHEGINLRFPDHECSFRWDETQPADTTAGALPACITMAEVIAAIARAKASLLADAFKVGIDVAKLPRIYHLDLDVNVDDLDADDTAPALTDVTVAAPTDSDFKQVTTNLLVVAERCEVRHPWYHCVHALTRCQGKQKTASRSCPSACSACRPVFRNSAAHTAHRCRHCDLVLRGSTARLQRALGASSLRCARPTAPCTRSGRCMHSPSSVATHAAVRIAACAWGRWRAL